MTTNARKIQFVKKHSKNGVGPVIVQVLPALIRGGVERGTIEIAKAIIDAVGRAVVPGAPTCGQLESVVKKYDSIAGVEPWPYGARATSDTVAPMPSAS